jgi:hypothetical protein
MPTNSGIDTSGVVNGNSTFGSLSNANGFSNLHSGNKRKYAARVTAVLNNGWIVFESIDQTFKKSNLGKPEINSRTIAKPVNKLITPIPDVAELVDVEYLQLDPISLQTNLNTGEPIATYGPSANTWDNLYTNKILDQTVSGQATNPSSKVNLENYQKSSILIG